MPYLSGVLSGILLTILVVFIVDHLGSGPNAQRIVNWDYVGATVGASVEKIGEGVRQEVHDATAPDGEAVDPPPPANGAQ